MISALLLAALAHGADTTEFQLRITAPAGQLVNFHGTLRGPSGTRIITGARTLDLRPGEYRLDAFAEGFTPLETFVVVPEGQSTRVVAVMQPETELGTLRPRAIDLALDPVKARWTVNGGPALPLDDEHDTLALPAGTWEIRAYAEGYAIGHASVEVVPGDSREVTVAMRPETEPSDLSDGPSAAIQ